MQNKGWLDGDYKGYHWEINAGKLKIYKNGKLVTETKTDDFDEENPTKEAKDYIDIFDMSQENVRMNNMFTLKPQKILNKWQIVFYISCDYEPRKSVIPYYFQHTERTEGFLQWLDRHISYIIYNLRFGIFKFIELPEQGCYWWSGKHKGFILRPNIRSYRYCKRRNNG